MRFPVTGPGRVGAPLLDPGDQVALADRHGQPVGEWVTVLPGLAELAFVVPDGVGPVKCYVARDSQGRIQYWSEPQWHPAVHAGDRVWLPLRFHPRAERIIRPRPDPVDVEAVPTPPPDPRPPLQLPPPPVRPQPDPRPALRAPAPVPRPPNPTSVLPPLPNTPAPHRAGAIHRWRSG